MPASSVTGIGQGAADKNSPQLVKTERLIGPLGPRILMAGKARMEGGEVTVTHPELSPGWLEETVSVAISYSAYPVWVHAYNSTSLEVHSLETVSTFDFVWMIIAAGTSTNLDTQ